jgi:serine phosphatase RsbU (regulator of sigma subunit)
MSVAAEMQWSLLPPLAMSAPQVAVAGILEPAYNIAGDSFDYAFNDTILHAAVFDAMGHGLEAATMATVAVGAYRHAPRAQVDLSEKYTFMDHAIAQMFGPERFVTAQMMHLDVVEGSLLWVNAGHPAPLLIRNHQVVERLESATTLPVGFGGQRPKISGRQLHRDDRVLFYTDGVIEERNLAGDTFGEDRLINCINSMQPVEEGLRGELRRLSHTLKEERGGHTSDDATLFLVEWRGGTAGYLTVLA